jgi:hypothetical protein
VFAVDIDFKRGCNVDDVSLCGERFTLHPTKQIGRDFGNCKVELTSPSFQYRMDGD